MYVELQTVWFLLPEVLLVLLASLVYVVGAFVRGQTLWTTVACVAFLLCGGLLIAMEWNQWKEVASESNIQTSGPLIVDFLGFQVRLLSLLAGLLFTLALCRIGNKPLASEQLGTLMMMIAGIMIVSRANELVFLFVGLELVSIPTYILLFLARKDRSSGEATAKYFYLSILSSAVLLYGFSFLYGLAGTTVLSGPQGVVSMATRLAGSDAWQAGLGVVAAVLVFGGLGFKIAAVPFHFYAPDVYQGTSHINAGILAVAPKIAGMIALSRIAVAAMPSGWTFGWQLAVLLAILTMTLGNVTALWQQNIRRLMAYSSIAHAGYMLIGLSVAIAASGRATSYGGIAAVFFYLVAYSLSTAGLFAAFAYLGSGSREINDLSELGGVARKHPAVAAALAVFIFSLMGIPPLAGFWGKLTIFTSAISMAQVADSQMQPWFVVLAVLGVLNAAIAAAYYLKIIGALYFAGPDSPEPRAEGGLGPLLSTGVAAFLVVLIGCIPGPLAESAGRAETSLRAHASSPVAIENRSLPSVPVPAETAQGR